MRLTDFSLRQRSTVAFLMLAAIIAGMISYRTLPREAFPDIKIPVIIVYTLYPGASPPEIETQVTNLVERELQGLAGVKELRSTSQESVSLVEVEFDSGTDIDEALQKVRDRVDRAKVDFPSDAEEPLLQEINFSDIPILQVNLAGEVGPVKLKELAEEMEDRLESLPGVLRVNLVGGLEREVEVAVDPERLRLYGLALPDVVDAIRDENAAIPGGDIDLGDRTFAVRIPGEAIDPLDVANFVVKSRNGSPTFVRDVATVRYGFKDRRSFARIDGQESVALTIQKRLGANVVEVADTCRAEALEVAKGFPEGVEVFFLGDLSKEVRTIVSDLENNILSGLVLVVLVLMFVLGFRNALLVGLAIPFSMLLTFIAIQTSGVTLNNVVLFSLVLAVGMLVDNAVVVIENVYRHMQMGKDRVTAAADGTAEVGQAIAVSTFTTVAAFAPLLFWPGIVGDFMFYLPLTLSIVLMASLLVALTVNPVLCAQVMRVVSLPQRARQDDDEENPESQIRGNWLQRRTASIGGWISRFYEGILTWALNHRSVVILGTFLCFVSVLVLFGKFNHGVEFFPQTEPPQIFVNIEMPAGTRLEKTDEVVREIERRLAETPDLEFLSASVGAGSQEDFGSTQSGDASKARVLLDLVDRQDRSQSSFITMDWVRRQVTGLPGVSITVKRPDEGPPTGAPVEVEVRGKDFAALGAVAARIKTELQSIEGLVSLDDDFDLARPELRVLVDRVQASRLGLNSATIASTVRTAINGTQASTFRHSGEDQKVEITVRLAESSRRDLEALRQLTIGTEDGDLVPLGSIATLRQDSSLTSIKHKNRRRVVTVSGDVTSPQLAEPVRSEAFRRLEALPDLLTPGTTIGFAGQSQDEDEAKEFLSRAFLYALILVLALIVGQFNSLAVPAIIMTSVLMSMVGVLVGLLVVGLPFGIIMTGLGVISLAGIVVNNAIVLLDYGERLRAKGGRTRRELILTTGMRRLRPVLLTAITTILGLIPLSTGIDIDFVHLRIGAGGESSQWWKGMGVAVIFGLGFATFLTLVLVPVLYDLLLAARERRDERRRRKANRLDEVELDSGSSDSGSLAVRVVSEEA